VRLVIALWSFSDTQIRVTSTLVYVVAFFVDDKIRRSVSFCRLGAEDAIEFLNLIWKPLVSALRVVGGDVW